MGLFNKNKTLIGVDIGSYSVKVLSLKESGNSYKVEHIGEEKLPSEAIVEGTILNFNAVSEAIANLFRDLKITNKNVAASISGNAVFVKKINMPSMTDQELDEQLKWEAEQYLPFNPDEVNIDYDILERPTSPDEEMSVLLVAAKKEIIEDYRQVIEDAGLKLVVMEIDSFSLQNAFELNYEVDPQETIALANIGANYTNINVLRNGISLFTRDISVGGNKFTEELQRELNLSYEEAEELKKGEGEADEELRARAQDILTSSCNTVATELQRTLDFYSSSSGGEQIGHIFISGGTVNTPNIAAIVTERTGINTELFNPFNQISCDTKRFGEDFIANIGPSMAICAGLALRRLHDK